MRLVLTPKILPHSLSDFLYLSKRRLETRGHSAAVYDDLQFFKSDRTLSSCEKADASLRSPSRVSPISVAESAFKKPSLASTFRSWPSLSIRNAMTVMSWSDSIAGIMPNP